MDSPFMSEMTTSLCAHDVSVVRFEFPYMAGRRSGGSKRPPPKAEALCDNYLAALTEIRANVSVVGPLMIGGKSLGGRVASMVADTARTDFNVDGLVCLGYPFHPPRKPDKLRTTHLGPLGCPTLICQGTRDPLGHELEVADYDLSESITIHWVYDGDHDFAPRKRSGTTQSENIDRAAIAVAAFVATLT